MGLSEIRKKLPTADRVYLGDPDGKDGRELVLAGDKLSGPGMARLADGWQDFTFECTLDADEATATGFVFTIRGPLRPW